MGRVLKERPWEWGEGGLKLPAGQLPQGPPSLCVPLQGISKASLDNPQAHNDPWPLFMPIRVLRSLFGSKVVLLAKLLKAGYGLES